MKTVYSLDAADIAEIADIGRDRSHMQNLDWADVGYLGSIWAEIGPMLVPIWPRSGQYRFAIWDMCTPITILSK